MLRPRDFLKRLDVTGKEGTMASLRALSASRLGWAALCCGGLATLGCAREAPAPAATVEPARTTGESELAVLPNNMTLLSAKNRIIAIRGDGDIAWELALPDGDTVIAPVAVGLNSVTYVRGAKAIHAALPEGKWLWSKPLEGQAAARSRAANTPVAMSDSTVALVVGDDLLRFDHDGAVRWRISLPEGKVLGRPAAGMDGSLLVHTSAGVYSVNPEGTVSWRRVVGT
jgi:outer membrane protein assembly factor BamB